MPWTHSIRTRIVAATSLVVLVSVIASGVLSARLLTQQVEAAIKRDMERTTGLVVQTGFLSSPGILEQVALFLRADVLSLNARGDLMASNLQGARFHRFKILISKKVKPEPGQTRIEEIELDGQTYTLGWTTLLTQPNSSLNVGSPGVVLVYEGHILSQRRRSALQYLALLLCAVLILAMSAGILVSRSVVKPIERLARQAQKIGHGEWQDLRTVDTGDEVEILAHTLAQSLEDLQRLQKQLEHAEKLGALGQLSASLAHEVRNPLSSIKMMLKLEAERLETEASGDNEASLETLQRTLCEIERLTLLTTRLLTFMKGPVVHLTQTRLEPIADSVLELMSFQLEHLGIDTERDWQSQKYLSLDPDVFRLVVLNLVQNAAESMAHEDAHGHSIKLSTQTLGQSVQFSVIDQGPGLAPEAKARLFEPFFTTKDRGLGLGLALTRMIVEAHHGQLIFEATAEGGTAFHVQLPLQVSPEASRREWQMMG